MVERGEGAGDVVRRVVRGGVGRAQTDALGGADHDTEHDAEIELHRPGPEPDGIGDGATVDPRHGQAVVEEHHVEAVLFEGPAQLGVVARGEKAVLGGGMSPRPRVDRGVARLHEPHQRHLPHGTHRDSR